MCRRLLFTAISFVAITTATTFGNFEKSSLPPPEGSYKILMLLPLSSKSHRNGFLPLAQGLLSRGHKVWMLSALPPLNIHPNFTEVTHNLPGIGDDPTNVFDLGQRGLGWITFFKNLVYTVTSEMYEMEPIKQLYDMKEEFDVVIYSDLFAEPAFIFLEGKPSISLATSGITNTYSALAGNVLHPGYRGSTLASFPRPFSFLHRTVNFFLFLSENLVLPWVFSCSTAEEELQKRFPEFSSLENLRKNTSLTLINSHFSIDHSYPLLPSQVEVAAMHCKSPGPLPQDLESWLNKDSENGVIYFSLGSIAKGSLLPEKAKESFVKAFKRLDYKIIWKFEDDFPDLPSNILTKEWLPQNDVLGHPKIKLFITHGGLLSTQEAIYNSVPMLVLPVFGDQPRNARLVEDKKFGLMMNWKDITEDSIVMAVREILENPVYRESVQLASTALRDQITSPIDTAIWWTEYVIRNKGAPNLKTPAASLSNREYFMLDVLLVVHVVLFVLVWLIKKTIYYVFRGCFRKSEPARKLKSS